MSVSNFKRLLKKAQRHLLTRVVPNGTATVRESDLQPTKRPIGIRNLVVGLAASGACVFLGALLLGQQQGTQRLGELQEEADHASTGCVACHGQTDSASMHSTGTVRLGCTDCHGGNAEVMPPAGVAKGSPGYDEAKKKAHPKPSIPEMWKSSANPV